MNSEKNNKKIIHHGLHARLCSFILLAVSLVLFIVSLIGVNSSVSYLKTLSKKEDERTTCEQAIQSLLKYSDYLTSQVEQFVIRGEKVYLDNYWHEINVDKNREKAFSTIIKSNITEEEEDMAVTCKGLSDSLILVEKHAMKLMVESLNYDDSVVPAEILAVNLSMEEDNLTPEEKREAAINLIFGPVYASEKTIVQQDAQEFQTKITSRYSQETSIIVDKAKSIAYATSIFFFIFLAMFLVSTIIFIRSVIAPLTLYSKKISTYEEGKPLILPEKGSFEVKNFAKSFNSLATSADDYTKTLSKLGYYDYLTNVPNRASITKYVEDAMTNKIVPLGFMIFDIDDFKHFNDSFGHAIGDIVLVKVASKIVLSQKKRKGISGRLCGEEFIVSYPNATKENMCALADEILQSISKITASEVGLPDEKNFKITLSGGGVIWNGKTKLDFSKLLSYADSSLYVSKQQGKNKFTYHKEIH
jgi:diguanylate cyclase (GGDEF)-like protein